MTTQKTVVILQSSYLPWLGFFDQLHQSDIFVLYDDVQYTRRDWRNRNRVLSAGGSIWLTVPVYQKGLYHQLIKDARINNDCTWAAKHLATIQQNYARCPYFEPYFDLLHEALTRTWEFLTDLNLHLINEVARELGLEKEIVCSSDLGIGGSKTERLVNICKHLGATRYLSGDVAETYLEKDRFARTNIELSFHRYQHPAYRQAFEGFVPYLSVIDLLFNEGPRSLAILTNGRANAASSGNRAIGAKFER